MLVFISALRNITSYPFSLGWSEGNRLWDYSILFGRDIYVYPADQPIPVLLDIGRQFVGGIPFLISGVTIWQARLWGALVNVIPYLILGFLAFKLPGASRRYWMLTGVWAMTFVVQGPIHPPLLLCAILVAFAWRKPLWLAIPLIMIASYFAAVSRFTWLFAPGMWAGMLELSAAATQENRLSKNVWVRAISVGLVGAFGGYLAPFIFPGLIAWAGSLFGQSNSDLVNNSGVLTVSGIGSQISEQALLWYRLFPNATYGYGILLGLFLATAPLIAILLYLSNTRRWPLNVWQRLAIALPLLAFLVVGLIVSVKIGGGGDLHNMDMFIIGVMFAAAIAWRHGGHEWVQQISTSPVWVRTMTILLIVLPAHQSLLSLTPISIREDMRWVMTLADIPPIGPFPELLPSEQDTQKSLNDIRSAVEFAASQGDILFMDQRQLLTFGYVKGVPLVPEYDKKVLINQAMSANTQYFSAFYKDLANHRFSLIISNPLHEKIQTDLDQFGEENNAWVTWVSTPVLCYYEPLNTLKKITVQLLVPRQDTSGCEQSLPISIP
jgi:MFS family permease